MGSGYCGEEDLRVGVGGRRSKSGNLERERDREREREGRRSALIETFGRGGGLDLGGCFSKNLKACGS